MNPRTLTLASILSLALWCVAVLIGFSFDNSGNDELFEALYAIAYTLGMAE